MLNRSFHPSHNHHDYAVHVVSSDGVPCPCPPRNPELTAGRAALIQGDRIKVRNIVGGRHVTEQLTKTQFDWQEGDVTATKSHDDGEMNFHVKVDGIKNSFVYDEWKPLKKSDLSMYHFRFPPQLTKVPDELTVVYQRLEAICNDTDIDSWSHGSNRRRRSRKRKRS